MAPAWASRSWFPPPTPPNTLPGDIGTAAPIGGFMEADNGSWFVVCQARDDTDGDGTLSIRFSGHGFDGDALVPYLVLGGGPGERIDYPAAATPHGEWLA